MGIWRIGPRFGLALVLLAAVRLSGDKEGGARTKKAGLPRVTKHRGGKMVRLRGPLHASRLIVRNRTWSICWISGANAFW